MLIYMLICVCSTSLSAAPPMCVPCGWTALEGMKGQGRSAKASSAEKRNLEMLLQEGKQLRESALLLHTFGNPHSDPIQ